MSMSTPYDQSFKALADHDSKGFLLLLRALAPDEPVTILTPPRELRTPSRFPDLLYEVRSGDARRLVHVEAQTRYHSSLSERVLEYAALAWIQHRLPVASYVLLLTARDCPVSLGPEAEARAGELCMRFQQIKLWEVAADEALAWNRVGLLPFIPLMRGGDSVLRRVARRLRLIPDRTLRHELTFRFIALGCLRYDRQDLLRLVEEHVIDDDIIAESSFCQYLVEKGIVKGELQFLSRQLARRFGPLPSWAVEKLEGANPDTLESWGARVVESPESGLVELLASDAVPTRSQARTS